MIQFEEIIIEESINICEHLKNYNVKVNVDFGTIEPVKRDYITIQAILLIITVLTIYLVVYGGFKIINIVKLLSA